EAGERLVFFERWAIEAPRTGFILGCVLLLLAIPGLFRLTVGDNWTANFDPESELVTAERDFNRELWGTYRFDIVLEGKPEQFQEPAGIALLEEVVSRAGSAPGVAGTLSFLDPAGVVAAGYGDEGRLSSLPEERAADYLALAGVSEDPMGLSNYLTPDGSTARVQLFLKGEDYRRDRALEAELRTRLEPVLRGVDWHFSGDIPTGLEMVSSIVTNQLRSIGFTFLAIALLVAFTQRPLVKAALVVMFPVLAGTTLVFGAMGYLGVPLGVATSMFGSLALGIGVDFGIHFVHGYRQEGSLVAMMGKAGKAMRWSSAVLALGFLVLSFSSVRPNHSLGLLLAGSIVAAYGMTLLLLPALVGRLANEKLSAMG
ncbi:MAG TPA: MMPL family transporter, partial [Thermoanaerobaculia bacterium]|nr:MMPL family transporter [Thermoanaerobaculia bacterium]